VTSEGKSTILALTINAQAQTTLTTCTYTIIAISLEATKIVAQHNTVKQTFRPKGVIAR